jgi:gp16 family phage-associated protein
MKQTSALKKPRTREQARAEFERRGISVAEWSRTHKVKASLVYDILGGDSRRRCLRGQSHRIAVLLGIKEGELA